MPLTCPIVFIDDSFDKLDNVSVSAACDTSSVKLWGEDSWVGRQVRKKFWIGKGKNRKQLPYLGTITGVDCDADNERQRLFCVRYDDGDVEWLDAAEILAILLPLGTADNTPV